MAVNEKDRERIYDRIAQMTFSQIANRDIANYLGISESQVSEIKSSEKYLNYVSKEFGDDHDNLELAHRQAARSNVLYDSLEVEALQSLQRTLEWNSDPSLALQIAKMANQATRRGRVIENPNQNNNVIHITLNNAYVQQIQANGTDDARRVHAAKVIDTPPKEPAGLTRHEHNTVNERQVQDFLADAVEEAGDLSNFNISEFGVAMGMDDV